MGVINGIDFTVYSLRAPFNIWIVKFQKIANNYSPSNPYIWYNEEN